MKIVSYAWQGRPHYGVVKNDGKVVDLTSRLGARYPDIVSFIAEDGLAIARAIATDSAGDFDYEELDFLPVIPTPGKILCVGVNYKDHLEEANKQLGLARPVTERPMMFARWAESQTAHRKPIIMPKVSTQLDYEAELLVVIGKPTGRYLSEAKALEHVFGYSCFNDGSLRDYQFHTRQINPGKNFEKTGPSGPWIVTADEIPDPQNLDIEMRLNGERMQHGNTRQMIHTVASIISYISHWLPLQPGDLIASGTMGGVGFARDPQVWMKPGDVAEVIIEGIGTLRNEIAAEEV